MDKFGWKQSKHNNDELLFLTHVVYVLQVPTEQADAWARSQGMLFLEASAKSRMGIRQVFMEVVKKMLDNPATLHNATPGKPRVQLQHNNAPNSLDDDDEGGCC
mgnify:CR=1 FL=1